MNCDKGSSLIARDGFNYMHSLAQATENEAFSLNKIEKSSINSQSVKASWRQLTTLAHKTIKTILLWRFEDFSIFASPLRRPGTSEGKQATKL